MSGNGIGSLGSRLDQAFLDSQIETLTVFHKMADDLNVPWWSWFDDLLLATSPVCTRERRRVLGGATYGSTERVVDRCDIGQIYLRHHVKTCCRFGAWVISFTPHSLCLSGEALKAVSSFHLVSWLGEVKYLTQEVNVQTVVDS